DADTSADMGDHLGADTAPERPAPAARKSRRGLRSLGPIVGEARWTHPAVRWVAGFAVFFLAFLLRGSPFHGFSQNEALGALVFAAAAGGLIGTGAGALFRRRVPRQMALGVLVVSIATSAA